MTGHPDPTKTLIRGILLGPYLVAAVIYPPIPIGAVLAAAIVALFLLPYGPTLRTRLAGSGRSGLRHRDA